MTRSTKTVMIFGYVSLLLWHRWRYFNTLDKLSCFFFKLSLFNLDFPSLNATLWYINE